MRGNCDRLDSDSARLDSDSARWFVSRSGEPRCVALLGWEGLGETRIRATHENPLVWHREGVIFRRQLRVCFDCFPDLWRTSDLICVFFNLASPQNNCTRHTAAPPVHDQWCRAIGEPSLVGVWFKIQYGLVSILFDEGRDFRGNSW